MSLGTFRGQIAHAFHDKTSASARKAIFTNPHNWQVQNDFPITEVQGHAQP